LKVSEAEKLLIIEVLEYQIRAKSARWIVSFLDDNQVPIAEEIVRKLKES